MKESIIDYFAEKAGQYDLVDHQAYWRFSDSILKRIFEDYVVNRLKKGRDEITVLDAGAGTGRWTVNLFDLHPNLHSTLIDLSPDMLREAQNKLNRLGLIDRTRVIEGDLDRLESQSLPQFDLIICLHNVLGFVQSPQHVIRAFYEHLRDGGMLVILVPNYYHNLYFNVQVGQMDLAREAYPSSLGRFTQNMPNMHLFTPDTLSSVLANAGFGERRVSGFPNLIYPGYSETTIDQSTQSLGDLLSSSEHFEWLKSVELDLFKRPDVAARGNQLIGIAVK